MIVVCPHARLDAVAAEFRPALVILLHAPGDHGPATDHACRRYAFHDVAAPGDGLVAPDRDTIAAILAAAAETEGPILASCQMGISRSPAVAFAVACQRAGPGRETALAASLRRASPCCTPNPLVVAHADAYLRRQGRMTVAIAAIGRGADYAPYRSFTLDLSG